MHTMDLSSAIEHLGPTQQIDDANINHDCKFWIGYAASFSRNVQITTSKLLRYLLGQIVKPCVVYILLFLALVLFLPLCMMVMCSIPKILLKKMPPICYYYYYNESDGPKLGMAGIYNQARGRVQKMIQRMVLGSSKLLAMLGLLLLVWLALSVSVPSLRSLNLLGSPLWKWSLLGVTLTTTYFWVATWCYVVPLDLSDYFKGRASMSKTESYYRDFHLGLRMILVIHLGIALVLWLLYFRTGHGLNQRRHRRHFEASFEYVTWTFVSLFVGSVLWLLKGFALWRWCEHAIYRRLETKIDVAGLKLLFLGAVFGGFVEDETLNKLRLSRRKGNLRCSTTRPLPESIEFNVNATESGKVGILKLNYVGDILTSLAQVVRSREEDCVPDIIYWFHQKFKESNNKCDRYVHLVKLFPSVEGHYYDKYSMASDLHAIIREQWPCTQELTFDHVKKWMVDAHIECVNMGRTLADAKAIVTHLDIFLSSIILVVLVLFWLLITGIATTKVLVTIATPILALTFIFGDTAKAFFQGIIFYFGTHPFDVGDRCVLDQGPVCQAQNASV